MLTDLALQQVANAIEKLIEIEREGNTRLEQAIKDVDERVEALGLVIRDLPDEIVRIVEKKIYELRTARWEALQAGVANEPAPLAPVPHTRPPTGSFALEEPDLGTAVDRWAAAKRFWWVWMVPAWEVAKHGLDWIAHHLPK